MFRKPPNYSIVRKIDHIRSASLCTSSVERRGAYDNAPSGAHGSSSVVVVVVVVDTVYGTVERETWDRICYWCSRYIRDYIAQQRPCKRAQCPQQMEQRQCGNTTCGVCRSGREGRVGQYVEAHGSSITHSKWVFPNVSMCQSLYLYTLRGPHTLIPVVCARAHLTKPMHHIVLHCTS